MAGEKILHVGYDSVLIEIRESVLLRYGYVVRSVKGNQAAKQLAPILQADLAVIGNGGTVDERKEIVHWLSRHLPGLPILVMRVSKDEGYPGATVEFIGDTPSEWLDAITRVIATRQEKSAD